MKTDTKKIADRKPEKVTVREVIELLAKSGDWDAEARVITKDNFELPVKHVNNLAIRIDSVSQSTRFGVLIVIDPRK